MRRKADFDERKCGSAGKLTIKKAKWLEGIKPDTLISEVARVALAERLGLVIYYLPLAAKRPDEDVEYVHQLRVSVRRSQAALELFQPLAPLRRSEKLRKRLKKIRRAAGEPRDLDVFIARIAAKKNKGESNGAQRTLKFLRSLRKEAQTQLLEVAEWASQKDLGQKFTRFVPRLRWRDSGQEESLRTIAPLYLDSIVLQFFYQAEQTLAAPDTLHQLRIEAKRLRYAMELMSDAFEPGFRQDLYPYFENVQERLGEINDHATAINKIGAWAKKTDDAVVAEFLQAAIAGEEESYHRGSETFRQWWTPGLISDLKQRFDRYLRVPND
ncbi:CHAD domain-containing protein [Blastopirellula sp. JC732]|uniref:CHAD domain-containing protein n=1 Tax=Blastopirellula sediminis TaxID=2894196 RepID=A0A9X1MJN8_9BACT|nr:CHAD domain-containing protein [Blastopirellula sediminis]MCC9607802.1 CHAD domain-containing protein [Blastopirellula sediminis]MCC9627405.1 CHAD domain-containing protein [Blastopirellula sediminis]